MDMTSNGLGKSIYNCWFLGVLRNQTTINIDPFISNKCKNHSLKPNKSHVFHFFNKKSTDWLQSAAAATVDWAIMRGF